MHLDYLGSCRSSTHAPRNECVHSNFPVSHAVNVVFGLCISSGGKIGRLLGSFFAEEARNVRCCHRTWSVFELAARRMWTKSLSAWMLGPQHGWAGKTEVSSCGHICRKVSWANTWTI